MMQIQDQLRGRRRPVIRGKYFARTFDGKQKLEHVLIAEKALGHELPEKAIVHHVDGVGTNNSNQNLVICESQAYHQLLHYRQRMFLIGCDPDTEKKCATCGQIKQRSEFHRASLRIDGLQQQCKSCKRAQDAGLRTDGIRKECSN